MHAPGRKRETQDKRQFSCFGRSIFESVALRIFLHVSSVLPLGPIRFFFQKSRKAGVWDTLRAQLIFVAFQLFWIFFEILLNSGRGVGVWSVGDRRWRTLNQSFSRPSLVDCHRVTNQWRPHRNCSASFFVGIRFRPPTARSRVKLPTSSSSSSFYDLFL